MKLSNDILTAVNRKRGERDLTITKLAKETNVSRSTLSNLFNGNRVDVTPRTQTKLSEWLARNA